MRSSSKDLRVARCWTALIPANTPSGPADTVKVSRVAGQVFETITTMRGLVAGCNLSCRQRVTLADAATDTVLRKDERPLSTATK